MKLLREARDAWALEMRRTQRPAADTAEKYLRQVGTFPGTVVGDLTTPSIRKWLEKLPVGQPNRYRAAMSAFCSFLVREGVLQHNPVRDVPSAKESTPRDRHLSPEEADRLCFWLSQNVGSEAAALQAFLICTAADVDSALDTVAASFLEEKAVRVRGTKQASRHRVCYVTPTWDHLWEEYVASHRRAQHMKFDAPLWRASYFQHRRWFERALKALDISDYTMKDHRHTWAVQAFKDGIPLHAISAQLGHTSPVMALRVYGRHQSRIQDYRRGTL
jgi:integrase